MSGHGDNCSLCAQIVRDNALLVSGCIETTAERDAFRAEVERLKAELHEAVEENEHRQMQHRRAEAELNAERERHHATAGRVERLTAALSHLLGVGHSLKAFAGTMLRWREQPGVDFSDEAARIVRLAEENHQTIKAALLKETPWRRPNR